MQSFLQLDPHLLFWLYFFLHSSLYPQEPHSPATSVGAVPKILLCFKYALLTRNVFFPSLPIIILHIATSLESSISPFRKQKQKASLFLFSMVNFIFNMVPPLSLFTTKILKYIVYTQYLQFLSTHFLLNPLKLLTPPR